MNLEKRARVRNRFEANRNLTRDDFEPALAQSPDRDIAFTPGFSPVSNDDEKRETVFNGFLFW